MGDCKTQQSTSTQQALLQWLVGDMIVALDQVVRVELVRVGKQTTQAQKPTLSKIKYLVFLTSFATKLMFTET